ncbi:MAG: rhodanese-like domain-containing protein [Rhodobacteraceae bacterium]|nr:rhodanese-like domain-containing protein [Paracoccaceae bacterium]
MTCLPRLFAAPALALGLALAAPLPGLAADTLALETAVSAAELSDKKQTKAGLYITASEAGDVLAARDDVLLLDVRSPEETMLIGYPTAADANVPFKLINPAHELNAKKGSYKMMDNPGFVPAVKAMLEEADPAAVVVMCRSGSRSAAAVNTLTKAGVDIPLYSMIDGFEGDKNDAGRRVVNGWKNADLDWTYKVTEGLLQGVE